MGGGIGEGHMGGWRNCSLFFVRHTDGGFVVSATTPLCCDAPPVATAVASPLVPMQRTARTAVPVSLQICLSNGILRQAFGLINKH